MSDDTYHCNLVVSYYSLHVSLKRLYKPWYGTTNDEVDNDEGLELLGH